MRLAVQRRLPLRHVEPELLGVLVERLALEAFAALPAVEQVVHLPEAVGALLLVRLHRRLRGERRVGVHRERQVLPHEVDLVAVVLLDLVHAVFDALAERALEVTELDDGDLRRLRAAPRRVAEGRHGLLLRLAGALPVLDERVVEVLLRDALRETPSECH